MSRLTEVPFWGKHNLNNLTRFLPSYTTSLPLQSPLLVCQRRSGTTWRHVSSATALVSWLSRSRRLEDGLVTNKNDNYIHSERKLSNQKYWVIQQRILSCYVPNSAYCQMNIEITVHGIEETSNKRQK